MHYYQFNIGDYAKDTRHLSNTEDLAYRRMIDMYYDTELPLPSDVVKLCRLINMRDHSSDVSAILDDFFDLDGDVYRHKRIDREIAEYHAKADVARANGKKGGRPKKQQENPEKTQSVFLANPEETGSKANHKPLTNNQELETNTDGEPLRDSAAPSTGDEVNQKRERVPYQQIVDSYHEMLPEMPAIVELSESRKAKIRTLWHKHGFNIDRWNSYLGHIKSNCRWMMGGRQRSDGSMWKPKNLDFLITEKCYLGVREGTYNDDAN